jgi:hypothetical protein
MAGKKTRKKAAKASPKPMVVAREDLQYLAQVLQTLATATTIGPGLFEIVDHKVRVRLSVDNYGNAAAYLDPSYTPAERGRKDSGAQPARTQGDKISFKNETGKQVTLTFWNNANQTDSSIASQELDPGTLTLGVNGEGKVSLTDKRAGKGPQSIWVGIACRGGSSGALGSGAGGGPDMGIDDPK